MLKRVGVMVACAALLSACGKSQEQLAVEQAAAKAEQAAAAAAAKEAAPPTGEEKMAAARAMAEALCSSPGLMDEIETSLDVFEAYSGEGADKNEARNHFIRYQNRYRAMMEGEMPARGSSYKALAHYAAEMMPGRGSEQGTRALRELLRQACRGRDLAQAERAAGGLLFYCAAKTPD